MINYIKGTVLNFNDNSATILLDKIGFAVFVPSKYTLAIGQEISLFIYFNFNSENGPSLYGFLTATEKKIFELVISCSGIGPKIGLAVLRDMQPKEFINAITNQDIKALSSINGIGAKKAEQIIVNLKHKICNLLDNNLENLDFDNNFKHIKNISEVLSSLNYSKAEVNRSIEYLKSNSKQDYTFDQMLRQALSFLSKKL